MTDHNVDINKMAPGTLRDQLDAISPEPHPMRDNFLEAALYQAWRAGKLIPADEVLALTDKRDALKSERDRLEAALARACLVGGTTYLIERATKAEAEVERLKSLLAERDALIEAAYEKGLSDALGIVASIGYGATEDVDRGHEDAYRAIEKHLADWKAAATALRATTEGRE